MRNPVLILLLGLVALCTGAFAADRTIDPSVEPTYTFTCTLPVTRADGTPLSLSEIATVEFYRSADGLTWTNPIGVSQQCEYVEDLTVLNPRKWYYTATVTDTDGRQSKKGNVTFLDVRLLAAPSAIMDLGSLAGSVIAFASSGN